MTRIRTPLCPLLGIEIPIIQAPVGSATCPQLASAVSNAGGLGTLALSWRSLSECRELIRGTRTLTDLPFGVNLVLEWPQEDRLKLCLDEGIRIFAFSWGNPEGLIPLVHSAGGVVIVQAGSADEARQAVASGADAVIAQGWEAGGHVQSSVSTLALVPRVVDAVTPTPVVAAGGIADGRGLAAVLTLGADGAWIGTRFLASREAAAHPAYKALLVSSRETDTLYSTLFDVGWPNAPHRTLKNSTTNLWEASGHARSGERPEEGEPIAYRGDGRPVVRYSDAMPLPDMTGSVEALALYAGQGVGLINDLPPAANIVRQLVDETCAGLKRSAELYET